MGYLYLFQRSFVFEPSGTLSTPAEVGLDRVETVTLTMADGTRLTGWYAVPQSGKASVLYFHGNAGNLSGRADRFRQIVDSGLGLLAASYRGYPGSGGSPSEEALLSDGLELYDWLAERHDAIVAYGESLGTGVATSVAANRPAAALVLEAPFAAAVDIARQTYPWVPVGLLMKDQFRSIERIPHVEEPLLIVHGARDSVVPIQEGWRLYGAANDPKLFVSIGEAGHGDLWEHGLWPIVLDFLKGKGVLP